LSSECTGGGRKRFINAQRSYAGEEKTLLDELRYGLFLGSEDFVSKFKKKLDRERHREKPQVRTALKQEGIMTMLDRIFTALDVQDRDDLLRPVRGVQRPDRDLAIYILCHLGLYNHQEIGRVFGVGYTSVSGALKRSERILSEDRKTKKRVEEMLNDK